MTGPLRRRGIERVEPFNVSSESPVDRVAQLTGIFGPVHCPACGWPSMTVRWRSPLRESGKCLWCRSTSRNRQVALMLAMALGEHGKRLPSLRRASRRSRLAVYSAEARGPVHRQLVKMESYVASEYLAPEHGAGEVVRGLRHEDLSALSFPDETFDLVVTSDVLEHVPEPYLAHRQIHRILRPGGRHLFTVPFTPSIVLDHPRARRGDNGVELLDEPVYHGDPLRPDGALVFTDFSLEMLVRLAEIGFTVNTYRLHAPSRGILGGDGLVFEAVKPASP